MLPTMGATDVAFFMKIINLFVYSDESGVFDYKHNKYFLFGGLICFSPKEKERTARKYAHVETVIRQSKNYGADLELKASNISNADKGKFYRSLNGNYKFCVLIKERNLNKQIFHNKRHKQRYLDYAYKMVLKKCFEQLIEEKHIKKTKIKNVFIYADEHSTATDGKYELRESLLNEVKNGTFNVEWNKFFEPIFPCLCNVEVEFCDSSKTRLVRAADIIANHCFHLVNKNDGLVQPTSNMFVYYLPGNFVTANGFEYFENETM